jgi:hypothetical protein
MFKFFILIFRGIFQKISFPFDGMAKSFQISKSSYLFNFSHFALVVWPTFSKFKNKNFQLKFQKQIMSNFPCGLNDFFLGQRFLNLLKDCKNYLFTFKKIAIHCILSLSGMVHEPNKLNMTSESNTRRWLSFLSSI